MWVTQTIIVLCVLFCKQMHVSACQSLVSVIVRSHDALCPALFLCVINTMPYRFSMISQAPVMGNKHSAQAMYNCVECQLSCWGPLDCRGPEARASRASKLVWHCAQCTSRQSSSSQNDEICLQKYLPISGKLSITKYLKQNDVEYRSHLTIENNVKVENRYITSKRSTTFLSPQKMLGVRVETNISKNSKAIIMLALCPGRCLFHHKSFEKNDQIIFFHVTTENVKFAVS